MQPFIGPIQLLCVIGLVLVSIRAGQTIRSDATSKSVIVRVWLKSYMYPYKLKADREWCNPDRPNEPCSPAFRLCFVQHDTRPGTCDADIKFGGRKTIFASRNVVRFSNLLTSNVRNPIEFYVSQWKPYPSLNVTVTNDDFDEANNLIAKGTLDMDKLDRPALTKWRAKWHKVVLRLAGNKMKILIHYQAYEARPIAVHRQAVRFPVLDTVSDTPVSDPADESVEETVLARAGGEIPIIEPPVRPEDQPSVGYGYRSVSSDKPTTIPVSSTTSLKPYTTTNTYNMSSTYRPNVTATTMMGSTSTITAAVSTESTTRPATTTTTTTKAASTTISTTPCDSTPSTTTTVSTTSAPPRLSTGAIVGMAVGLALVVLLVVLAGVLGYKYRDVMFAGYRPLAQ